MRKKTEPRPGSERTDVRSERRPGVRREAHSALQKAIKVIEAVMAADHSLTAADIAARLDLPRQTAHRLIKQLVEIGLLQRDLPRDHYSLGPVMIRLSMASLRGSHSRGAVRAILEALVEKIEETCNLGVLDGHRVLYWDRVECDWPLRVRLEAGSHVPVHCTAIGKLLLAHLPAATRRRLIGAMSLRRYTANTLARPADLEAACADIMEQGFSTNNEEFAVGLVALAVPVFDNSGQVIAGLAVHAPAARTSLQAAMAHLPLLNDAAARITAAL